MLTALCVAGAIGLFYMLVDPSATAWVPQCLFRRITGLECPGCGAQRMIHALLHGDIAGAWGYNPFLLLCVPLMLFMVWLETQRCRRPALYARFYSVPLIVGLGVAVVAWFLVRNFLL